MKLRILDNAIRLRLKRSDLKTLLEAGSVRRQVMFPDGEALVYQVRLIDNSSQIEWSFSQRLLDVRLDDTAARRWAGSEEVGLYGSRQVRDAELTLSIEKDFSCKHERGTCAEGNSFHEAALAL